MELKEATIEEVLQVFLAGSKLNYTIEDDVIIISPKLKKQPSQQVKAIRITGKVRDEQKQSLPGVTIQVKGTEFGAATDMNGTYTLSIPNNIGQNFTLVFSFVGMQTQEIAYTGKDTIDVVLRENVKAVDEVVVVGYGTTKQKDFTGSVSSVKTREIRDVPFISVDDALAGKASGVSVVKADGSPGGAVRIRIRGGASLLGTNDPLYVIDGIPTVVSDNYINGQSDITNPLEAANYGDDFNNSVEGAFSRGLNNLSGLNIADIESIDILKDASATAIYGSKAANGVVIITTKKGRKDTKPQLNLNYYIGFTNPIKEKVLNAEQYKSALKDAAQRFLTAREDAGKPMTGSQVEQAQRIINDPAFFGNADTDWLDLVLRTGTSQNVDVSVAGGGANSRYYTSLSYTGQDGTLIGTDFMRISGKISLDTDVSNYFRLYTNLNFGYTKNNITNGIYGQALTAPPTFSPYNEDGTYAALGDLNNDYRGYQNPLAVAAGTNRAKTYSFMGSVAGEVTFLKDFKFKSTVSINYNNYNQLNYVPSFVEVGGFYGREDSQGGMGTQAQSTVIDVFFENTLTYDKEFNENHRLNVLAGTSWEDHRKDYFSASGRGYPDDDYLNNLSSASIAANVKGSNPESRTSLLSFYVRANYVWKDRYLFTFTGRADASSKFAPDNQYGFFPSGAIAWRISEENFLNMVEWIDEIKVRASMGKTGTQSIGDHMWRTLYSPVSYGDKNALIPTQLGNDKIKWESTVQKDLGLDFSFMRGRLGGTFGYYHKVTDGTLLNMTPAPSSSYSTVVFNIAKIRNQGLEFDIHGDFIRKKDFRWTGNLNISRNVSKVLDINGGPFSDPNDRDAMNLGTSVVKEGEPLGLLYGRVATGIIKTQAQLEAAREEFSLWTIFDPYLNLGDIAYEYEDGFWKEDVIGHATPDFFGGYTNTINWNRFTLTALFTFSYGNDLIYQKDVSDSGMSSLANRGTRVLNHYSEDNTSSNRPRSMWATTYMLSSLNVYDASYLKLKTLSLSYNLPESICRKVRIKSASVYGTATNVFTITSYPGPDPEVSDDPTSVIGGGRDVSTYPTVKSYTFGIRINF
ncbi:MAG TPA: SusC/RagA family TonB-linked outer membrane protein [Butyricimonas virosa]|nr:SusC/RagA family TonB-linked outer membrane protein [Butyricimonas virosa]